MLVYSGDKLKEYIAELKQNAMAYTGLDQVYERDFVNDIRDCCFGSRMPYVYIVCGFRATGKTFGLLQAVSNTDDTVYIRAQRDETQTGRDYIEFLRNVEEKNIIIDEYTWIKDIRDLSYYLWTLVENGKRIAITGTHSLALDYLEDGILIHRAIRINVNMFSYEEFCRIYQKGYSKENCMEFLKTGGIFKNHALKNFQNVRNYIDDAVIDDLARFINLPVDEARAIVYDIMYLAVCDSNETKINYPQMRNRNETYRKMLAAFNINSQIKINPVKLRNAADVLEHARFIVKSYNFHNENEFRLHLVNPSLAYQMITAVFDEASADEKLGKAFEAYMVAFMSDCVRETDVIWYMDMGWRNGNPELELVIINSDNHKAYLFDSKLREAASLPERSSLVSDELENAMKCLEVGGRYVICNTKKEKCGIRNGKKVIFTRLDSDILQNYRRFDENYNRLSNAHDGNSNEENTDYTEEPQEPDMEL